MGPDGRNRCQATELLEDQRREKMNETTSRLYLTSSRCRVPTTALCEQLQESSDRPASFLTLDEAPSAPICGKKIVNKFYYILKLTNSLALTDEPSDRCTSTQGLRPSCKIPMLHVPQQTSACIYQCCDVINCHTPPDFDTRTLLNLIGQCMKQHIVLNNVTHNVM